MVKKNPDNKGARSSGSAKARKSTRRAEFDDQDVTAASGFDAVNEKERGTESLSRDVDEGARELIPESAELARSQTNWSSARDRSDDLIEHRDPFVNEPEAATELPPEVVQRRAHELFEARGYEHGDDLSDWFEAEKQLRRDIKFRQ